MTTINELVNGLRLLLADEDCGAAIYAVAAAIRDSGAEVEIEIETNDGDPEALNNDDALWVMSDHALLIDGDEVATWQRCAVGDYGDDGWQVDEDTDGDDKLPDGVAVALNALGMEDSIPDVPEPPAADEQYTEDPDGEYAVYWETVGDDAHVVARYASLEAAEAVCDQRNREFREANPSSGTSGYLCGYSVRGLADGQWVAIDEDDC